MRVQQWAFSDLNPWVAGLGPAAAMVKAQRQPLEPDSPTRKVERMTAEMVSASLDYYRAIRDAMSEAAFFQTYGNMFALYTADQHEAQTRGPPVKRDPLELPFVKEALASIDKGGYAEALARLGSLLAEDNPTVPLAQLELKDELIRDYADLLPVMEPDARRRIRGEQDIIVRYAREKAIETLPKLLAKPADRDRLLALADRLRSDPRLLGHAPTAHDTAVLEAVRKVLGVAAATPRLTVAKTTQKG
jgi:hypothetical protein